MKATNHALVFLVLAIRAGAGEPAEYAPPAPAAKVATLRETWRDAARERDVPVKIYYPEKSASPAPVIIFSHGLGGTRDGYAYLGERWAGCGYISVHVQHLGSDDAVWRKGGPGAMRDAVLDVRNAINRLKDVTFAIDRVLALNGDASSPLHARADAEHIGIAGHSFGGWTTLAATGERLPLVGDTLADPRLKAGIAMSPPVPKLPTERATAFADIKVPIFVMTGTLDNSPLGETAADERRIAFDKIKTPGSCLLIFKGADHMSFAIQRNKNDANFHALINDASTAFWDAHLRGNAAAAKWLEQGGFASELDGNGTFERK